MSTLFLRNMKIVSLFILSVFAIPANATLIDTSTIVKWDDGSGANGHYYALTTISSDFLSVQAAAEAAGGELVSIGSAAENAFLVTAFHMVNDNPDSAYWIGLVNPAPNNGGTFQWLDGSPVTYTNWDRTQPDNCGCDGAGQGMYTTINAFGSLQILDSALGGWADSGVNGYDGRASTPGHFQQGIVEFDSAVPEPASWAMMIAGIGLTGTLMRRRRAAFATAK